jgi:hypothetical protein
MVTILNPYVDVQAGTRLEKNTIEGGWRLKRLGALLSLMKSTG